MKKIERMKKHSRMLKSVCMKPFASMKLPTLTVRILSTLCALTMVGLAAQAQLLYKISGKDLTRPSYIVGTMHVVSSSFVPQIVGIDEALNTTDCVVGEIDFKEALSQDFLTRVSEAMMLPEGKTIKDLLTSDEMKSLNKALLSVMGGDFDNPVIMAQMGRMAPAALSNVLTVMTCMKRHADSFDSSDLIDLYFQKVAQENNKATDGLETGDEQMRLLYGQPLEKQVRDLVCLCEHFDRAQQDLEDMIAAYKNQDLKRLGEVMDQQFLDGCSDGPQDRQQLVVDRNRRWVEKMPTIMSAQPSLFVVGAGHLAGDDSVLTMLRQQGYVVEAVER